MTARPKAWLDRYGPWAVVTGASSGIGLELARALANRGMNLVIVARSEGKLETLSDELTKRYDINVRCIAADLSQPEGTTHLFESTKDLEVGLFIANAGFGTSGPFNQGDIETELAMIDLNVRSLATQTHHYANQMLQRQSGGIILLSSIVCWQGVPRAANYAATKAYVQSLAEGISRELKPQGIDVLSSAPAQVSTGFNERANMQSDGAKPSVVAKQTLNALGKKTTVYPHFKSRFLSMALATLPRSLRTTILAGVMKGMTDHQSQSGAAVDH